LDKSVSIARTLSVFEGRWKVRIIHCLGGGPLRFGELRQQLNGITAKVLTQQLRELERDGVVHRQQFRQIPPKVVYTRTGLGDSLLPLFEAIRQWDEAQMSEVAQSRERYDAASEADKRTDTAHPGSTPLAHDPQVYPRAKDVDAGDDKKS